MLFSKSSPLKKQDLLFLFLILISAILVLFENTSEKNGFQESYNTVENIFDEDSSKAIPYSMEENLFVPGIAITLNGNSFTFNGDSPGCTSLRYVIRVLNTSTNGESIDGNSVVIDMGPDIIVGPLTSGDTNSNNQIDVGEVWFYEANRPITEADKLSGEIIYQAHIEASVVGSGAIVMDDSHPSDINLDGPTVIKLSCSGGVNMILKGVTKDISGNDGGCAFVLITYEVHYTSIDPGETFESLIVYGQNGSELIAPDSGDNSPFGVLDPDEIWIFTESYTPTAAQVAAGEIQLQGYVEGVTVKDANVLVSDISDPIDLNADNPTIIDFSACTPSLSLIKTGEVVPGCEEILYTFTVTNQGNNFTPGPIKDVIVEDVTFPLMNILGPQDDLNNDGVMSPGEVWVFTGTHQITTAEMLAGEVVNQARVTGSMDYQLSAIDVEDDSDFEDEKLDRPTVVDISGCMPSIALIKQGVVNPSCSTIDYTFTVTNEGGTGLLLNNVALTDAKLPLINGPVGDNGDDILDSSEIWTYTATYNITAADITAGKVDNQAKVTADVLNYPGLSIEDDSDDDNILEDQITTVDLSSCQTPAIQVTKQGAVNVDSDSDGCFDGITYTFTVANTGNVDLHTIVLDDDKVDNPLIMLAQPLPGEDEGGDEVLSVGEDWVFQATYSLQQADIDLGSVDNQANVTALSAGDDTPVNDSDSITTFLPVDLCAPAPAIQVTKQGQANVDNDNDGCIDGITYTFTVANIGNVDLNTIALTDDKVDNPLMLAQPLPGEDEGGDQVLSIGEDWVFQATYSLQQADIDLGSVDNQANVTALSAGDNTPVNDSDSITTFLPAQLCAAEPAIQVTKQGQANVDNDNDGCIDGITYTFTVANIGNVDLNTIVLNDDNIGNNLPGPLVGEDEGGDQVLSVGEDWIFQATYDLQQEDIDLGSVDNQADVTALSVGDNTPVNDSDNITTFLPAQLCAAAPGIALIKTGTLVDLNTDGCTETILYSFTVVNTGNVDIGAVELVDEQLGGTIVGPSGTSDIDNDQVLSVGENWTYEAYKEISQIDIDMGSFNNQATVTGVTVGSNQEVMDFSDNNSVSEDDSTNTLIPIDACTDGGPSIGLIKIGVLTDTDGDDCPDGIKYIFTATNTGSINLEQLVITDEKLLETEIIGPMESSDINGDGILSVGESWTYEAIYTIKEEDTANGTVNNQANITAITVGMGVQVFDQSDDDSLFENETTSTATPEFFCDNDGSEIDNSEFKIFTGITPNGDGVNDYFRINNIENYPDNVLKIFNRWGSLVYETENYALSENLFRGISEGKATVSKDRTLPSGTYFYTLFFKGVNPGEESYSGYIYINRD
jgi:gliding motility-associated-like protein